MSFKGSGQGGSTGYRSQQGASSIRSWASLAGESEASVSSPKSTSQNSIKTNGEMRRLTDKELQEKRAKGLCFKCDEK